MSGYDGRRRATQTDAQLQGQTPEAGQGNDHSRLPDDMYLTGPPEPGRDTTDEFEITAGQKMLSAMSGSLLTSLIGTPSKALRLERVNN